MTLLEQLPRSERSRSSLNQTVEAAVPITRILSAAGAALLLAACGDENAEQSGNNAAVPANGGEAVNAADTGNVPSGTTSQPPPPIEPDPSDRPPIEPTVQVNNQVSSPEDPPATEDEYIHRNKAGESPPPR